MIGHGMTYPRRAQLEITRAVSLLLLSLLPSVDVVFAQTTPADDSVREARLAFFQERIAEYRLVLEGDRVIHRTQQPVFRWSHPAGTTVDAAFYVWLDAERPAAFGCILIHRDLGHFAELQSVTAHPLKAVRSGSTVWEPVKKGCEFGLVPNAPKPADTAAERLTQMKMMARRFGAELIKGPPNYSEGSIWRLRLLPKQLLRYGGPQATAVDGALFAFCHDTDPEVLLMLEASGEKADLAWHFAFAPMTGWKATGTYDDKPVWSQPRLHPANDSKLPYISFGPYPLEAKLRMPETTP